MIKFKDLKTIKSTGVKESFAREVKIVCDDFTVESYEKNIHDKVMQKVSAIVKDGEKFFDLEEYKNIMLHYFNYELNCFKTSVK